MDHDATVNVLLAEYADYVARKLPKRAAVCAGVLAGMGVDVPEPKAHKPVRADEVEG